jgi:hypothetical protein
MQISPKKSLTSSLSIGPKSFQQIQAEARASIDVHTPSTIALSEVEVRSLAAEAISTRNIRDALETISEEASSEAYSDLASVALRASKRWDFDIIGGAALHQLSVVEGESLASGLAVAGMSALEKNPDAGTFYAQALAEHILDPGVDAVLEAALDSSTVAKEALQVAFRVAGSGTGGSSGQALKVAFGAADGAGTKRRFFAALAGEEEWTSATEILRKSPSSIAGEGSNVDVSFLVDEKNRSLFGLAVAAQSEKAKTSSSVLKSVYEEFDNLAPWHELQSELDSPGDPQKTATEFLQRLGLTPDSVLDHSRSGKGLDVDWPELFRVTPSSTKEPTEKVPLDPVQQVVERVSESLRPFEVHKLRKSDKGGLRQRFKRKERKHATDAVEQALRLFQAVDSGPLPSLIESLRFGDLPLSDQVDALAALTSGGLQERRLYSNLLRKRKSEGWAWKPSPALVQATYESMSQSATSPQTRTAGKLGLMGPRDSKQAAWFLETSSEFCDEKGSAAFAYLRLNGGESSPYLRSLLTEDEVKLLDQVEGNRFLRSAVLLKWAAGEVIEPDLVLSKESLPTDPDDLAVQFRHLKGDSKLHGKLAKEHKFSVQGSRLENQALSSEGNRFLEARATALGISEYGDFRKPLIPDVVRQALLLGRIEEGFAYLGRDQNSQGAIVPLGLKLLKQGTVGETLAKRILKATTGFVRTRRHRKFVSADLRPFSFTVLKDASLEEKRLYIEAVESLGHAVVSGERTAQSLAAELRLEYRLT